MPNVALIYDSQTLILRMVVIPESEVELNDPSFHPKGCTHLRITKETYSSAGLKGSQALVPGWPLPLPPDEAPLPL